ncbi:expressed protein [Phakopsora pachyrhizi]|uniref:Expressed protein n=1 Tax=Phakopsora pachyrhizi TaxID=170000 RepID=A0AAV0BA27_PHAPC|nr:expressed protein [Phakopsora pachyrhizi]
MIEKNKEKLVIAAPPMAISSSEIKLYRGESLSSSGNKNEYSPQSTSRSWSSLNSEERISLASSSTIFDSPLASPCSSSSQDSNFSLILGGKIFNVNIPLDPAINSFEKKPLEKKGRLHKNILPLIVDAKEVDPGELNHGRPALEINQDFRSQTIKGDSRDRRISQDFQVPTLRLRKPHQPVTEYLEFGLDRKQDLGSFRTLPGSKGVDKAPQIFGSITMPNILKAGTMTKKMPQFKPTKLFSRRPSSPGSESTRTIIQPKPIRRPSSLVLDDLRSTDSLKEIRRQAICIGRKT